MTNATHLRFIAFVALGALYAVALAYVFASCERWIAPHSPGVPSDTEAQALAKRLDALEARVGAPVAPAPPNLEQRLDALEQAVRRLGWYRAPALTNVTFLQDAQGDRTNVFVITSAPPSVNFTNRDLSGVPTNSEAPKP